MFEALCQHSTFLWNSFARICRNSNINHMWAWVLVGPLFECQDMLTTPCLLAQLDFGQVVFVRSQFLSYSWHTLSRSWIHRNWLLMIQVGAFIWKIVTSSVSLIATGLDPFEDLTSSTQSINWQEASNQVFQLMDLNPPLAHIQILAFCVLVISLQILKAFRTMWFLYLCV